MAEGEFGCTIEAFHEGADAIAILGFQTVHARSINLLNSGRGGDPIELSMKVHDKEMEAVLATAAA